jgi:N4-gp56 family major capsid protein
MTDIKEPEQLTAGVTMIGSSSWGSQTGGIGSVMGSTWSEKIIFDAQPDRVLSKYFIEFTDLMNNNDVTIVIPKIGDVDLMGGRTGDKEGIERTMTKFDSADNITVSLTSADVKLGGCAVSFETASATRVSIVEMAHKQLVRQYLNTLETDAANTLETATVNATTGAGSVFGGTTVADNTALAGNVDSLATGDVVDVDKIVDMKIRLQNMDFAKKPGDAVLFLHPTTFKQLLKSSQFTNAAEFGASNVVRKGVIEEYIGVKIEVSTLVSAGTTASNATYDLRGDWGAAGHFAYMIDPSAAAGIVWKEKAKVKVETKYDERKHKILLDAWYQMTVINPKAICLGCFTDA